MIRSLTARLGRFKHSCLLVSLVPICGAALTAVARADTGGQTIVSAAPIGATASTAPSGRAIQIRLVALGYLPAHASTGTWDYRTAQAITAFQACQHLSRDGIAGPRTIAALVTAKTPRPAQASRGHRIEVYRSLGVMLLLDRSRVIRAIHVSTGKPGYTTPTGAYTVFRKERNSWSYPYCVWLPYASYLDRGIALHSYSAVPRFPASRGCVRVAGPEAAFVYDFAANGTSLGVY